MDIEKEREAFEKLPEIKKRLDMKCVHFNGTWYATNPHMGNSFATASYLNGAWMAWQAKAQAVPEGFVLVKNVHPDAIVHNQGLSLFKECQVIYGWDNKSKDFKDALNKGFYHGVKLGVKAVLESTGASQ